MREDSLSSDVAVNIVLIINWFKSCHWLQLTHFHISIWNHTDFSFKRLHDLDSINKVIYVCCYFFIVVFFFLDSVISLLSVKYRYRWMCIIHSHSSDSNITNFGCVYKISCDNIIWRPTFKNFTQDFWGLALLLLWVDFTFLNAMKWGVKMIWNENSDRDRIRTGAARDIHPAWQPDSGIMWLEL